jgi:hypothetical protein
MASSGPGLKVVGLPRQSAALEDAHWVRLCNGEHVAKFNNFGLESPARLSISNGRYRELDGRNYALMVDVFRA